MLISFGNAAQVGNSYLSCANQIAFALEKKHKLKTYDLCRYSHHFACPSSDLISFGSERVKKIGMLAGHLVWRAMKHELLDCGPIALITDGFFTKDPELEITARMASSKLLIHHGWKLGNRGILKKHVSSIKDYLALKPEFIAKATERMVNLRGDARFVIGVHVRRGDYKTYRAGQYYFKDDTYLRIALEALRSSQMHSRDVVIVGFSNEKLDWNPSLDGSRVSTPVGEWWEDFLALSMCDLIIGPPSTFSAAASLAGNVLWYQIKDRSARYDPAMARTYLDSGVRV
jgi:hypothetical protein